MNQVSILVIDDSATIRRLVDATLSPLGYRLTLSPTAEDGLERAAAVQPDLILLDHQLPGTTGADVCHQLLKDERLRSIPVVVSSTLRKKAYAEYTDLPNVVDMLPKPYSEELLTTTVANALETGCMVLASQSQGTAVPETIHEVQDADLSGNLSRLPLRDVLDFLNQIQQDGRLEVESRRHRYQFHLRNGKVQAVTASGLDAHAIALRLPTALQSLTPVLSLTIGGRRSSQLEGVVDLLNRKVLDPRLLRALLRFQAAVLVDACFGDQLKSFRFHSGEEPAALFQELPLEISLSALLVESAQYCSPDELPADSRQRVFTRKVGRGQHLDRSGLSARHMQLLSTLAQPLTVQQIVELTGWDEDEILPVLHGFVKAELVEHHAQSNQRELVVIEGEGPWTDQVRGILNQHSDDFRARFVRDRLTLQVVLKRTFPKAVLVPLHDAKACEIARQAREGAGDQVQGLHWVGVGSADSEHSSGGWNSLLEFPFSGESLIQALHEDHPDSGQTEPELVSAHDEPNC